MLCMPSEIRKILFYTCHKKFSTLLPFLNFAFELALLTAGVTGIVAILATKNTKNDLQLQTKIRDTIKINMAHFSLRRRLQRTS